MEKAKFLYKFLKKHNCLKEYVENIVNKYNKTEIHWQSDGWEAVKAYKKTNQILPLLKEFDHIGFAFYWEDTPQGNNYWFEIEKQFRKEWYKWIE